MFWCFCSSMRHSRECVHQMYLIKAHTYISYYTNWSTIWSEIVDAFTCCSIVQFKWKKTNELSSLIRAHVTYWLCFSSRRCSFLFPFKINYVARIQWQFWSYKHLSLFTSASWNWCDLCEDTKKSTSFYATPLKKASDGNCYFMTMVFGIEFRFHKKKWWKLFFKIIFQAIFTPKSFANSLNAA